MTARKSDRSGGWWAAPIARHYAREVSLVCIDGVLTGPADAVIPVTDEGLLRGDSVSRSSACTPAARSPSRSTSRA